jgi:hypothetical protein
MGRSVVSFDFPTGLQTERCSFQWSALHSSKCTNAQWHNGTIASALRVFILVDALSFHFNRCHSDVVNASSFNCEELFFHFLTSSLVLIWVFLLCAVLRSRTVSFLVHFSSILDVQCVNSEFFLQVSSFLEENGLTK